MDKRPRRHRRRDDACFHRRRECGDDLTGDALWAHIGLPVSMDLDLPTWFFISITWVAGVLERHCQVLRRAITARLPPPEKPLIRRREALKKFGAATVIDGTGVAR
jgi:hypothetical protein